MSRCDCGDCRSCDARNHPEGECEKASCDCHSDPVAVGACSQCGKVLEIGDWPFCPHGKGANYGWKWARGQNEARKEKFFKDAAANPFAGLKEE